MLKDITLGQYFPGNSLVHRLDPRTKLLAVVLYAILLVLLQVLTKDDLSLMPKGDKIAKLLHIN